MTLVTHQKDQPYSEYVMACKQNEIARQVKLSDLRDNGNPRRLLLRPEKFDGDSARMQRYVLSDRFLTDEITEDECRRLMQRFERYSSPLFSKRRLEIVRRQYAPPAFDLTSTFV